MPPNPQKKSNTAKLSLPSIALSRAAGLLLKVLLENNIFIKLVIKYI